MADDYSTDEQGNRILVHAQGAGTTFDATKNARRQDVSGLAATIKKGQDDFVPPKMQPGEDMGAYGSRVSLAREAFRQKKAMGQ